MRTRSILLLVSALYLAGCPGSLQDPDRFGPVGGSDGGGGGACDVEQLLSDTCTGIGCHGAMDPAEGVDLMTAGVADRLVDTMSTSIACTGRIEIDSADPANSLLLEKITMATPTCGAGMPFLRPMLTADEIACVEAWVMAAAAGGM